MIKKILCAIDFSPYTDEVLQYASEFAKKFNAQLHLIHVIPPMTYIAPYESFISPENILLMEENIGKEVEENFEKVLKGLDIPAIKVIRKGVAFAEIIDYAKKENIDLIVLGTHGRSGVEHIIIGSVAEKVVRKSPCPVLTIRPKSKKSI